MKNNILYSFLFSSLILCSILFAEEPFAPVIEIPENPKNDPDLTLAIAFLNDVQVPDKDAVGVPAYPEAKIFQTTKAQAGMLPTVRLLSADKISDVVEFYKKEPLFGHIIDTIEINCCSDIEPGIRENWG
jgi:hypothetical protein